MRKVIVSAIAALAAFALVGCSNSTGGNTAAGQTYHIGIAQLVSHPSLDATVTGFKAALKDAGINADFDEQNAQNDQGTANSIAAKFATQNLDLVLAVATPMAQAAAQNITDTPVLFTAVTDPVKAQLVKTAQAPGSNVTGTTDMNPVADQIDLIKKVAPDAKKVGVIYASGEVNSEVQVKLAQKEAEKQGLELVKKTITNSSEVVQAAQTLGDVDAIYVPTDNTVVSALDSVLQVAEPKGILVVVAEADSVENGGALTLGLDYEKLGYQTGQMAVKILKGEAKPATMPVESQKNPQLIVNPKAAKRMGFEIPKDLQSKAAKVINVD